MSDRKKTKEQLLRRMILLGRRVAKLKNSATERKRVEEALRESEERFHTIFEKATMGIGLADLEGRILSVNPAFLRMLGYAGEELTGKSFLEFTHADDVEKERESFRQLIERKGDSLQLEKRYIRKDGQLVWANLTASLCLDNTGTPHFVIGMAEDITERKRAEEALQIERNKLEVVTRHIGAGLAIISKDYRTLWGNETLKRIFGDIEGKICYSTYNRKTEICSGCGVREVYEKGSDCAVHEQAGEDIEGNTIWSEIIATPIKDKNGNITAALELVIPITERKWAEEVLRRRSGEQALLLDNIQTQIWYLTDKETYGAVNKARAEFFGKKNGEMENKKLYDVLSKDEAEICMSGYVEVFEKRKQVHTEEWIANAKGEKRLLSIIKSPKLDENGEIEYVVCSAEDITERKRTEEKVHTYQEQLRSLSSELSLIEERERRRIATDLHDHIGQALAFIKIKFGMLREMVSPLGHIDHIDEIQNLIEQAIHYTRSLTFELSPPVLYDLGFDAAVEWLVEQIQDQHHIQVDLEYDRQSKPMSDEIRISLFKAVRELLINIAKHAKAHKAKVSTRREDNTLRIIVEDDGVGFSLPEDKLLGKIAGYGLFNIREQLKHLGGSFEIESNLGCGTRVTLVAPLEQANNKGGIT